MFGILRRLVLVGLIVFGLSIPAFGATTVVPKQGSPCPKLQMRVAYRGMEFACLKSGKKLLWSPGKKFPTNSGQQGQGQPPIPSGLKALYDAGRFGIVRNLSSNGARTQPMDCTKSDGNQGFRSQKTFLVDPSNPQHLYVAVEFLGFYFSNDGGQTWKNSSSGLIGYPRIDDPLKPCHTEFADVAIDPSNSQHLILSRAAEPGLITDYFSENAGLDESKDGGKSWRQILTQPNMGVYVHDGIAISHQSSQVIYAGTTTNARMLNGENKIYPKVGVVYKTVNGGLSWVELATGAPANINVLNIFIDPLNDKIVTVATAGRIKSATGSTFNSGLGILKTLDGGATWMRLDSQQQPLNNVEFSDNSPRHLIACCSSDAKLIYSDDGGASWKSNPGIFGPRAMGFDQTDKSGLSGLVSDNDGAIFYFQDGGASDRPAGTLLSMAGLITRITKFGFGSDGTWYAAGHYTGQRGGVPYQEGFVFKSSDQGGSWIRILDTTKLEH